MVTVALTSGLSGPSHNPSTNPGGPYPNRSTNPGGPSTNPSNVHQPVNRLAQPVNRLTVSPRAQRTPDQRLSPLARTTGDPSSWAPTGCAETGRSSSAATTSTVSILRPAAGATT